MIFHKTEKQWKNEEMGQRINLTKFVKSWTIDEPMWFNDVLNCVKCFSTKLKIWNYEEMGQQIHKIC
jgi:hypothetical protein